MIAESNMHPTEAVLSGTSSLNWHSASRSQARSLSIPGPCTSLLTTTPNSNKSLTRLGRTMTEPTEKRIVWLLVGANVWLMALVALMSLLFWSCGLLP